MANKLSRKELRDLAKSRDIVEVAESMGMELFRSGKDFRWKDHDSLVISPNNGLWNWYSQHKGGDVISLVETIKEINFNQAIDYITTGNYSQQSVKPVEHEEFNYYLENYEQPLDEGRKYLKDRGLSDGTIDFFSQQGLLTQANILNRDEVEPGLVFKSYNADGELVGANLQGIRENRTKYPKRGYLKQIIRNSDGLTGLHVDIGQPNRLVFAESPIDLMSYYELHKDNLQDVRLVSMDGLKDGVIGRHLSELTAEQAGRLISWSPEELAKGLELAKQNGYFADGKHADMITLAVDNDQGGRKFIQDLVKEGIPVVADIPDLPAGKNKMDWNDQLKLSKQEPQIEDNPTLYQASPVDPFGGQFDQAVEENEGSLYINPATGEASETQEGAQGDMAFLDANGYPHETEKEALEASQEKTNSEPDLQVVFHSSDENLLSDNYSLGDIIPYDTFIRALYTENNSRLEAMPAEDIPVFPPLHITNEGGTWFDLRDENGQPLVENIRYDIGGENQTISERLEKVLPSDYLEIARQKDATYPKPVLPEAVSQDSGIPVDLYTGHQNFGTIDFNDLLDSSDLGSHADKLGYGWAVDPRETFAVINNETLSQTQVDKIIDRMFATGADGNDLKQYLQNPDFSLSNYAKTGNVGSQSQEKPLDNNQETPDSNDSDLMAHKKNETIIGGFSEQAQEAAPLPEAMESQPLKDSSLSQSESHSLLQFTIENPEKSRYKAGYHPINQRDLTKLNNYAENIQNSAQWYLNNLADSTIHYFYQRDGKQYNISIGFEEKHFMHFTGLFPLKDGQTAEKTLHDFAEGRGNYDNLLIANKDAAFQKVKVLPDLKAVLETDSFYFDQVSDIPKLHSLNMEKAIKSDDRDVLLAFSSNGENVYPASLMELTKQLNLQSNQSDYQNVILGIYRERDGQLEQVAINEDYIKDGGQEMFNTLKAMNLSDQEDVDYNLVEPPQVPLEPRPKSLAQRAEEIMEEDRLKAEKQAHSPSAEKDFDPIKASPEELSAHALDQIRKYSTDPKAMKEYLDFMSHFPGMSPRNAALVQEQWPGAQAVATYNQWQDKGKALGIKPDDVYQSTRTFTNKKTGKTKTVHYDQLSVKAGEKSKITLLRPVMVKMIPVMDATGKPVKTEQGRTKYKPQSEASPAEKAKIKSKELPVKEFMSGKFTTYKVFELSQTTLKPESYPKAMPNRQFDFDMDKVQTDKVLKGLCDYGNKIGVEMSFDKTHKLGNAKGAYFPKAQTILINPNNTPGEQVATSIHELAHATLHNPKFMSKGDVKLDTSHKELEAEMTAYIVSKHFGLDTSEESIPYMASWTDNLNKMSDKELDYSMKRVHKAADQVVKCVENRTNPTPPRTRDRGISSGPKPPVPKPLNP